MKVTLLGYKVLDFKSSDNTDVKGTQAFVSYEEEGVIGCRTDKFFFKDGISIPAIAPGDTLDITFNRHGKPESIHVVSNKQINLSVK